MNAIMEATLRTPPDRNRRRHLALDNAAPIIDSPISHLWEHRLLVGVTPTDPLTFTLVPLVLLTSATLACYVPAGRAVVLK